MQISSISALCSLDGRYSQKLEKLRPIMSEFGFMKNRIKVEIKWFIELSKFGIFKLLSDSSINYLNNLIINFNENDCLAIKSLEKTTNHDVKAVEYWLKEKFKLNSELKDLLEFIHFACTSEDINNVSHALQLKETKENILLPALNGILIKLKEITHLYAEIPMLSRTHGQNASPTTVGKEIANVYIRLKKQIENIKKIKILAKMNGAVGNYNAHILALPNFDWESFSKNLIENELNLDFQDYSTQIENHDYMAEFFNKNSLINTILIDFARDIWGYISLGYFKQKLKAGEIGSSTMPHKVNPIDFENAEGNLGLSNALLKHLAEKLPISRFQRDLTDSTVLRNMGVALGYSFLAYQSLIQGLNKLEINEEKIKADIDNCWEILAEPIQTIMRLYKIPNAYEQLKELSRGKNINKEDLHKLIKSLNIPEQEKKRLLDLKPSTYLGKAIELAKRI